VQNRYYVDAEVVCPIRVDKKILPADTFRPPRRPEQWHRRRSGAISRDRRQTGASQRRTSMHSCKHKIVRVKVKTACITYTTKMQFWRKKETNYLEK